jgi:hypothetical protein
MLDVKLEIYVSKIHHMFEFRGKRVLRIVRDWRESLGRIE